MQDNPPRLSSAIFDRLNTVEGSSSLYILWGFFAFAAIAAAVAVCFTPGAGKRFTSALHQAEPEAPGISRLADVHPIVTAPDPELAARLKALEDQLDTITGSVGTATSSPKPAERADMTPIAPAAPAPLGLAPEETRTAAPPENGPVSRTTFGIDLGSETSFGALRARWDGLRKKYPDLARLSPRISVRDNKGKVELRLIAGPFENAADAAKACASLIGRGIACDGGLFDGQRLPAT